VIDMVVRPIGHELIEAALEITHCGAVTFERGAGSSSVVVKRGVAWPRDSPML
jgi:hypothetical protein